MTQETFATLSSLRAQITQLVSDETRLFADAVADLHSTARAISLDADFAPGVREEARKIAEALNDAGVRIVRAANAST